MARNDFNFAGFLLRLGFAIALVFLTFNPSGYSWFHWIRGEDVAMVYKAASGIVLLIGWVMFLRATWNSLGALGTILATAFFAIIIWPFIEWQFFSLDDAAVIQWVVLFVGVVLPGKLAPHVRPGHADREHARYHE